MELINENPDFSILSKTTEAGREFQRIAKDVVDKLARERTGAVVSADEEESFKDIVGVGFFNQIRSSDAEMITALSKMRQTHVESVSLVDPTGKIGAHLDTVSVPSQGLFSADEQVEFGLVFDDGLEDVTALPEFNAGAFFR